MLATDLRIAAVRHAREDVAGCELSVGHLVRLLADAVQVPVVVASLLTVDRQVLVASQGLSGSPGYGTELRFGWSLCEEVVSGGLPLIVDDVARDQRFMDRAGGDQQIGSYAGFPVRGDDGQVIGVLDVAGHEPRHWSPREFACLDSASQLFAALLTSANATDTRASGEAERREALIAAVLDSLDTGVAACDAEGGLVLFNRAMRDFLGGAGYDDDSSAQWAAGGRVRRPDGHPVTGEEMPLARALASGAVRDLDLIIIDAGGQTRMYRANAEPIDDANGARLGAVTALHDVTDEVRAQRFRRCEIAAAQAVIRMSDVSDVGHATLVALAETLGWPYAELWLYNQISHTMRPAGQWHRPGFDPARPVPTELKTGAGLPGLAWLGRDPIWVDDVHADGIMSADADARSPLNAAVVVPLRIGEEVYGALNLFTTTAERSSAALNAMLIGVASRLAQYVQHSLAEALTKELVSTADSYLHLITHEIRTPLTSISAYTELLTDLGDLLPVEAREMLQAITRNSGSLRRIVDRLLELAALDSNHATLVIDRFDFTVLLRAAITNSGGPARDSGIQLVTDMPETLMIDGDDDRLRRVVDELLSNAIAYSHPGGLVTVTLRSPDTYSVTLTVTDAGIGIPSDELSAVFKRFHRSSRVRELGLPGTGLGLAYSRAVLHQHHGSIDLHLNQPGGTTATMRLPIHQMSRCPRHAGATTRTTSEAHRDGQVRTTASTPHHGGSRRSGSIWHTGSRRAVRPCG